MRRRDIEKLKTVSIKGELYVHVGELVEALEAEKAEEQPERTVPRKADDKPAEKP
jgi:hypothetical protein